MFHRWWRRASLAALERPFDLVVIGGGINGCGIFFDAAQRGLRVLLVERQDLASGTSSRSSKLIHGGLRYLKSLQLGVTRTSVRERDRQLALNPHLVTPLPWLYPTYRGDTTPGWKAELGLRIYDALTKLPDKHGRVGAHEMRVMAPGVATDGLDRALVYQDARVDDARLTWAVAATGAAYGGHVLTRAEPEELRRGPGGDLLGLVIRDLEHGATHDVTTSLVVNATGVWVDQIRHRFGLDGDTVRPSRGSHILLAPDRLPLRAAVTVLHPADRRPAFLIPHPEGVLVGTTDLFHGGELDDPRPTPEEIDYLLAACAAGFVGEPVTHADIRGAFAGVRPIVESGIREGETPSSASREEAIWFEKGILSVAGGKLTTWRATAEEALDEALKHLPHDVAKKASSCATAGTPLARLAPADLGERLAGATAEMPSKIAHGMARRLGAAAWIATDQAADSELQPLVGHSDICAAEVRMHLRHGAVLHLSDLLLRRLRVGMWHPETARDLAVPVARLAALELGWDTTRRGAELERFAEELVAWTAEGVRETGAG
ncbi:MAG: glycerol-3-phosphate dehydrogenase/oxidase [Thermoanaerobaculia bacterium]|nr:glycerol-3-phosphate dehydrogenase/oxidase [Thermoanaerobaculia bacterium]